MELFTPLYLWVFEKSYAQFQLTLLTIEFGPEGPHRSQGFTFLFFPLFYSSVFYGGSKSWKETGQADPQFPLDSLVVFKVQFFIFFEGCFFFPHFVHLRVWGHLLMPASLLHMYACVRLFKTEERDMSSVQERQHEFRRCCYAVLVSVLVSAFQLSVWVPQVCQSEQRSESYLKATPSLGCWCIHPIQIFILMKHLSLSNSY